MRLTGLALAHARVTGGEGWFDHALGYPVRALIEPATGRPQAAALRPQPPTDQAIELRHQQTLRTE